MADFFLIGDKGQALLDKMNADHVAILARALANHVHGGGDPVVIERGDTPSVSGYVIINIDPTNKLARVIDTDGTVLGKLATNKLAVLAAQAGGLIALPGSGQSDGRALALSTSYQTLHQADPPAGYACLYQLCASSVDGAVIISLSLDGGSTLHGYSEIEEENGDYVLATGLMDPASATNLQAKADAAGDAFGKANILQVPLSGGGTEPGFVLPSGAGAAGFVLPTTTGATVHQCGAGSGYCDVVDLHVITRTANDVVITLNDGSNDFLKRTVPGASWQEILTRHILSGTTTLTAKADVNGYATMMAIIKRLPTS